MKILLVEDEAKIARFISRGLKEQKYAVDIAEDGEQAEFLSEINSYDLIILDIMLPKMDGFTVCKRIRDKKIQVPILMLTARNHVDDRVHGLNMGADDYLGKPFAFKELLARIRVLLRRQSDNRENGLVIGDLRMDLLKHQVFCGQEEMVLTAKEYALLEYFMRHKDEVITRTMISEHVWNEDFHSLSNVIDVHVRSLRRKIEDKSETEYIHTVRGVGYVLKTPSICKDYHD